MSFEVPNPNWYCKWIGWIGSRAGRTSETALVCGMQNHSNRLGQIKHIPFTVGHTCVVFEIWNGLETCRWTKTQPCIGESMRAVLIAVEERNFVFNSLVARDLYEVLSMASKMKSNQVVAAATIVQTVSHFFYFFFPFVSRMTMNKCHSSHHTTQAMGRIVFIVATFFIDNFPCSSTAPRNFLALLLLLLLLPIVIHLRFGCRRCRYSHRHYTQWCCVCVSCLQQIKSECVNKEWIYSYGQRNGKGEIKNKMKRMHVVVAEKKIKNRKWRKRRSIIRLFRLRRPSTMKTTQTVRPRRFLKTCIFDTPNKLHLSIAAHTHTHTLIEKGIWPQTICFRVLHIFFGSFFCCPVRYIIPCCLLYASTHETFTLFRIVFNFIVPSPHTIIRCEGTNLFQCPMRKSLYYRVIRFVFSASQTNHRKDSSSPPRVPNAILIFFFGIFRLHFLFRLKTIWWLSTSKNNFR